MNSHIHNQIRSVKNYKIKKNSNSQNKVRNKRERGREKERERNKKQTRQSSSLRLEFLTTIKRFSTVISKSHIINAAWTHLINSKVTFKITQISKGNQIHINILNIFICKQTFNNWIIKFLRSLSVLLFCVWQRMLQLIFVD